MIAQIVAAAIHPVGAIMGAFALGILINAARGAVVRYRAIAAQIREY